MMMRRRRRGRALGSQRKLPRRCTRWEGHRSRSRSRSSLLAMRCPLSAVSDTPGIPEATKFVGGKLGYTGRPAVRKRSELLTFEQRGIHWDARHSLVPPHDARIPYIFQRSFTYGISARPGGPRPRSKKVLTLSSPHLVADACRRRMIETIWSMRSSRWRNGPRVRAGARQVGPRTMSKRRFG